MYKRLASEMCTTSASQLFVTLDPVVCHNLWFFFSLFLLCWKLESILNPIFSLEHTAPWSCARQLCVPHLLNLLCLKMKNKKSGQGQCTNKSEHYSFACTEKLLNCMKLELMEDLCVLRVCLCSPSSSRSPWCRGGHVTHYCLVAAGNCSASSQIHNLHMIMIYF